MNRVTRMDTLVSVLAALLLFLLGCQGSYYKQYRADNPSWYPAMPDTEATLEEVVASIYQPPLPGVKITIRRLEILETGSTPWKSIPIENLRNRSFKSSQEDSYAVVAELRCRSRVEMNTFYGEKIAWYLLPNNRLSAHDHFDFVDGCTVHNSFQPAARRDAAVEDLLHEYLADEFPSSMIHLVEVYRRGIAYAVLGRPEEARRMLALGDSSMDVASERPEFEGTGLRIKVHDRADVQRTRLRLLELVETPSP